MPLDMWMRSVWAAAYPITTSGADMWLYSVRAWCSPNHAYFQLLRSAATVYSISRMSISCSHAELWAPGPGR